MANAKGSNDLNMLLKAKVVKLLVELDYEKSKLPAQVNKISKFLETKPVKLKVKLNAFVKDLNKQIGQITKTLQNAKTFKPLRISVEMDVAGSASKIKKQLKEVMDVVQSFNKQYGKQLQEMQQAQARASQLTSKAQGMNVPTNSGVQNFNNIKQYVKQIDEAEKHIRSKFGDNKGLFSSLQMKDAQGNLNGFIATLERANGVVEKVRYNWNKDKSQFQVVDRQTATNTEKMVHKASQSLAELQRELGKTGTASKELAKEYKDLEKAGANGTLTGDMVKAYQTRVKNATEEVRTQKELNNLKREEAKLIRDIANATKGTRGAYKDEAQSLISSVRQAGRTGDSEAMKDARLELTKLSDSVSKYKDRQKEASAVDKQRETAIRQLNKYLRETNETHGALSQDNIKAVSQLARRASSTRQMATVQKELNNMYKQQQTIKFRDEREEGLRRLQKVMLDYGKVAGYTSDTIEKKFRMSAEKTKGNLAAIEKEITTYANRVTNAQNRVAKIGLDQAQNSIVSNVNHRTVRGLVDEGDITKIKSYLAETQKLDIATAKLATNSKGVSTITTTLASTDKTAKQLTWQIDTLTGKLRKMGETEVFNRNANLGIFEQLRIAMERVPVWMTAMTAFYGSIEVVRSMTEEVLKLDKALTNIRRVASDSISVDTLFAGGIELSKELGNNLHDIMASIEEYARTFGDFNERQLIEITKTATLMSNVSDLKANEATESLVGTMNAFNIEAEESVRIVDALNEVDNNYAVSTKQLAEGLSKSASTSKTFGVTMEENIGHITAIASVTMESGKIIGNSLKTIYSRITTIEGARTALQDVGVAIEDQEGRVRKVNDILGDLSGRWNEISDAQRQNIGVQVAGRYQLSRFLALMNSWETASKATETAMHSEGSAMRENAEYMKSFEARINQLKNSWTELSSAVGDSVLSGAILMVVSSLTDLARIAIDVTNNFGALPTLFGAIFLVMDRMKFFDKMKDSLRSAVGTIADGWKNVETSTQQSATVMQRTSGAWNASVDGMKRRTQASTKAMGIAFRSMGGVIKGALASTGIGAVMVALGWAIEKLIGKYEEKKQKEEELIKLNEKMITSYRKHRDGMDGMVSRYDELSKKQKLTQEEQKELNQLQSDFAAQIPTTVEYVDANGKAHMKTADSIKAEIEKVKELSKEKAKLDMAKFNETLEKQSKNYDEVAKKIEKVNKERKKLEDENGKEIVVSEGYGSYVQDQVKTINNETKIQEKVVESMMLEAERTEVLKKTITTINDQARAYLEANNMMTNLTDKQLATVENFVNYNEAMLRSASPDEWEDVYQDLFNIGTEIGTVFSDAFDTMSASIEENDPQKAMKLEKLQAELDGVAASLPETFYSLTDAQGNMVKSSDDVVEGIKEIINVTHTLGGAGVDETDDFIYRLQRAGLSAEDAQGYLYRLANEQNNTAIKSELAARGIDETTGSLESLNEAAMEAIDLTGKLFGYTGSELEGVKSHIQAMELLIDTQGEGAKSSEAYISSQEAVADFLGVTADELEKNKDKYFEVIAALQGLKLSEYEVGDDWATFIDESDLSPDQKELMKNWNGSKDIITGQLRQTQEEAGNEAEEVKKVTEDIFKDINLKLPEVDVTSIKDTFFYVEDDIGKLQRKVSDLGITLNTPTGIKLFDDIIATLSTTDGKIDDTQTNMDTLRLLINTAVDNPQFLVGLSGGLDDTKQKAIDLYNEIHTTRSVLQQPTVAEMLLGANTGFQTTTGYANDTTGAIEGTKSVMQTPVTGYGLLPADQALQNTQKEAQKATEDIKETKKEHETPPTTNGMAGVNYNNAINQANQAQGATKDVKKEVESAPATNAVDSVTFNNAKTSADNLATSVGGARSVIENPFNNYGLSGVNTEFNNTATAADGVKDSVDGVRDTVALPPANPALLTLLNANLDTSSEKAKIANTNIKQLNDVSNIVSKVKSSINNLNETLGAVGSKFSTKGIRDQFNKVGSSIDNVRGKASGLRGALSNIGAGTGNLGGYITVIGSLSRNLSIVTQNARNAANAQGAVVSAFRNVVNITIAYNSAISNSGTVMGTTYMRLAQTIASATGLMINQYTRNATAVNAMLQIIKRALSQLVHDFKNASNRATREVENMADRMHREFRSGTNKLVDTAAGIPARIGKAIRDNMTEASGVMDEVAQDMVRRFKSELGIHSPSRVFEDLGYWTIKGLANGLGGEDLKSLGKSVFDDFGGGVYDSWDMIKAYVSGDWSSIAGGVGGGSVQQWAPLAAQALQMTGQMSEGNLQRMLMQMQSESGGNPAAINLWDINAKRGIPSKGLMQVIDPTFRAYAMPGYNKNVYDPLSNMLASIRYAVSRYGSLSAAYRGVGYAKGGLITEEHLAMVGEENKKEMVIPLEQHRNRALGLWQQAGQYLGVDPRLVEMMKAQLQRGKGGVASGGQGSFGASSGEGGGESGGGDSGTSGVLQTSIYDGLRTMDGGYDFISLASKDYENRPDAFTYDKYDRTANSYESQISVIEAKMNALDKTTVKYRDSLKSVIALENKHLSTMKTQLSVTEKRQKTIDKELKKLPSVNKQTTKQREKYNSLMQEYDQNISKISSLKTEIENEIISVKDKSLEIFTDFISEIVRKYDESIDSIKYKIDDIDFRIDVKELVTPSDQRGLMNLQIAKANQLQAQQATGNNKVNALQTQYDKVGKSKGYNSKEALAVKEELHQALEDYEEYTLAVLQAEKEIKDTRASVADAGISTLKDYYSNMKEMATKAIDLEKEAMQKAHEAKMDMYDEESSRISAIYDERLAAMDEEKKASDYQEELDAKNLQKAEMLNKISLLSRDTSLEGRKKLAELKAELTTVNKEIADFQKERQDELLRASIEEQKQAQLDAITSEKETEQTQYDKDVANLDIQKEQVTKQYDDLINNDKYWAQMRNTAITGSFTLLQQELGKMNTTLVSMSRGVYDKLYSGFSGLSEGVKKQVAELNSLEVGNMKYNSTESFDDVIELNSGVNSYKMTDGKIATSGTKVTTPNQTTPAKKTTTKAPAKTTTSKPKTTTKKDPNENRKGYKKSPTTGQWIKDDDSFKSNDLLDPNRKKAGYFQYEDGSWGKKSANDRKTTSALNFRKSPAYGNNVMSVIPKNAEVDYIGMEKGWAKIKYKGKTGYVGNSYLKKFDTGGYTGDWAGKEGKVAMLHKKELVLNERQTSDILDASKIMDKISNVMPDVKRTTSASKLATAGSIVNYTFGDINLKVEGGDKKKAKDIATEFSSEIVKELKKKGK